ncbi:hypothetical protein D9756_004256 [Leucocoprinus leucothites]|uniref:Rhodanese domain-containing protein n=1 Tax=Leucocoprinus leucothites TaxID=201217 RepID=A0A8H5LFF6_9AGAR|nr:hypothetical protein D9756_004256 [Leucoagaricus leucothites]
MASLARTGIARNIRVVTRRNIALAVRARPTLTSLARFNSSQAPSSTKPPSAPEQLKKKATLERQDDLQRDWDAKVISYEELFPITESPTPDTYLVDVREPNEVIQGMIPSAVNLPLTVLADSLHLSPEAFLQKHGFDKPKKSQRVIFYCRSGMRSTSASDVAKRNGYKNILNYKGSWLEWTEKQNTQKPSA